MEERTGRCVGKSRLTNKQITQTFGSDSDSEFFYPRFFAPCLLLLDLGLASREIISRPYHKPPLCFGFKYMHTVSLLFSSLSKGKLLPKLQEMLSTLRIVSVVSVSHIG